MVPMTYLYDNQSLGILDAGTFFFYQEEFPDCGMPDR
jgi:hypothetical protein